MSKLFVWDLDDTLIANVHDYSESILEMIRTVINALGHKAPHVSVIIALEEEIDKRRVNEINPATGEKFLYSMERFPGSLVETYRAICLKVNVSPDKVIQEDLYRIGMKAFDPVRYKANIFPEATEVVKFLRDKNNATMLLSKGDKRVQANKLQAVKANELFCRIRVVDNKTPQIFREMRRDYETFDAYSIGNDYEKDIAPALEAGYRGILIPVETWEVVGKMDEILAKVDRDRCLVVNNIGELRKIYGEL